MAPRPKRRKGFLVAVEGIDGTGKTTLLDGLRQGLVGEGWKVGRWKEPSDTLLGKTARQYSGEDPAQAALLFTLDRGAQWEALESLLLRSDVVISDRSYFSTLAYQGSALSLKERASLEKLQLSLAHRPDLVLWLRLSPADSLRRVAARGSALSPLERRSILERTARAYASYARKAGNRFLPLDASRSPPEVARMALDAVQTRLKRRSGKKGAPRGASPTRRARL